MTEKQHGASAGPGGGAPGAAGSGPGGAQAADAGQGFGPAAGQGFAPGAQGVGGREAGPGMSPGMGAAPMGGCGPDPAYGMYGAGFAQMPQHPAGMGLYGASSAHPAGPYYHGTYASAVPPHHMAYGAAPMGVPYGAAPGMGMHPGQGPSQVPGGGPAIAQVMSEIANGGGGLSSLGKLLNFDDSDFWKGALVGAAAVLLLTNESVQNALFKTGARAKDAVERGVEKVKTAAPSAKEGSDD